MYVRLQLDKTTPSRTIPIPSLLALPSNPIAITMKNELQRKNKQKNYNCLLLPAPYIYPHETPATTLEDAPTILKKSRTLSELRVSECGLLTMHLDEINIKTNLGLLFRQWLFLSLFKDTL
jgi:hypothetical protein